MIDKIIGGLQIIAIMFVSLYAFVIRGDFILDMAYIMFILLACFSWVFFDSACFASQYYINPSMTESDDYIIPKPISDLDYFFGHHKFMVAIFFAVCVGLTCVSVFLVNRRTNIMPKWAATGFIVVTMGYWLLNRNTIHSVAHCYFEYLYLLYLAYIVYLWCWVWGLRHFK